jgi:hypothetical protein
MRLLLFFFLLLVDSAFSSNIFILTQQQHAYYSQWKSNYGKSYQSGEVEAYRLTLWVENYNRIELHNAKYRDGAASYFLAPNHFSDLPLEEIENMLFYKSLDAYVSFHLYRTPIPLSILPPLAIAHPIPIPPPQPIQKPMRIVLAMTLKMVTHTHQTVSTASAIMHYLTSILKHPFSISTKGCNSTNFPLMVPAPMAGP